jgi:hypothetical protein
VGLMSYSLDNERRAPTEPKTNFQYDESAEKFIIHRSQHCGPILQENWEKRNADDGYTKDRSMKRVAQIPLIIVEQWLREEGWNALEQGNSERVLQKIEDPEWSYLKTSEGKHYRKPQRNYYRGSCSVKPVFVGDTE